MSNICPECGIEYGDEDKFCRKCGTVLKDDHTSVLNDSHTARHPNIFENESRGNSKRNIVIITVVAVIAIAIVSAAIIFSASNGSGNLANSDDNGLNLLNNENNPIHIINTTFYTEHSLSGKTVCEISFGKNHSGEKVHANILYSRDGTNLNSGDDYNKTIGSEGSIVCESPDSYSKYPDRAQIKIYDVDGNLLDSADIKLNTDDSLQLAQGNGTLSAKSITAAEHSASAASESGGESDEWIEDLDLSDKAGYDCHVYIHHKSDGTKYYIDDDGNKHTGLESEEWVF